ncbi:FAD-binding protein [Cohnella sp. JJ-181]|uniref:FAD-binding protein n=1 Tax=Cohnella rhizoplanae TaxID=2974897 RepID=UPI0022FFA8A3|nr:FAD-binding protein [Cohnella sp. JJ-181]CAI6052532.1 putative xylitol oxidase [Cohnella sp. JJ-181]
MSEQLRYERNWAGNYRYRASEIYAPASVEEVQEIAARSSRVKTLGSRHSFNGIADTHGVHVSLEKLNRIVGLDRANGRVTVQAGIRYGELCRYLDAHGFALPNLASLPHITVIGACATATHGSGDRNGCLATSVRALELVAADGNKVALSRDDGQGTLEGAVVGLGALGIVTAVTLDVVPAYRMSQTVYESLPLARLADDFEAIFSAAYSVSLFTDWREAAFNQVWVKKKETEPDFGREPETFYGAARAASPRHPVPGFPAEPCSEQLGISGPWFERLPHFRMNFTPSAGEELQSEYIVPRASAYDALLAIAGLRERIAPLLYISETRTIAADDLWMSPFYRQDSVAIHFTWKPDWHAVSQVLPLIETALAPYDARPHWGKLSLMPPERLRPLYERLPDFLRLARRFDPEGKFGNAFLERYVTGTAADD